MQITEKHVAPDCEAACYELIGGERIKTHRTLAMSRVTLKIASLLMREASRYQAFNVFGPDLAYRCFASSTHTVLRPSVTLIRVDRFRSEPLDGDYMSVCPDLVVELVSPRDTVFQVEARREHFLAAGCSMIWTVLTNTRSVFTCGDDRTGMVLRNHQEIVVPHLLPGFRCKVGDFFQI